MASRSTPTSRSSDNIAVTPWFQLTPDLQVIDPFREEVDTAVVLGVRGRLDF
jgi:porin